MERVDVGQLYMRPDPFKYLSSNRALQARLRQLKLELPDDRSSMTSVIG